MRLSRRQADSSLAFDDGAGALIVRMQPNLYEFQKRQILLIVRVTPYAMVGHLINTAVIAVALADSVEPVPLTIWCAYSCFTAMLLLFRHAKNRERLTRSFQRDAKQVEIYAILILYLWRH